MCIRDRGYPIIYVGATTAFVHAPEQETVYTQPPEGYGRPGLVWQLMRNINGRRPGGLRWFEWLAALIRNFDP
eukprot:6675370-Alexandrium_andersonii.AAC.1